MDIHHAMMVRNKPERLYQALTQQDDLEIWMDAPTTAGQEVGSTVEFHYDQGQRTLKMEIVQLQENKQVKWRVIKSLGFDDLADQVVLWTLSPYEGSTLVDFCMDGWPQDDDTYASLSYKWAMFMVRLKIHMGDTRELASLLPITKKAVKDRDTT